MSLIEAAAYVVPVAVANRETIERLRQLASDRYISAARPGLYRHENPAVATGKRAYDLVVDQTVPGLKETN